MFNLEIELSRPKVPYRETITRKVENVEGKLKKQTGGKGMFGVCYLTVEPLPRGGGFEFVDEIVGGSIPRNLIPAVEKGVLEGLPHGPLAGFPVVDIRVRCIDGKHHPVDSNEMAFKLAGSFGFKAATEQARPTVLEPVMDVEVAIPDEHMGDIIGDLNSRRGRVQATESRGSGASHQGAGPDVRNARVRERADQPHGRQGRVPHGFLALRGRPGRAPGQDCRRRQGRSGEVRTAPPLGRAPASAAKGEAGR